MIGLPSVLSPGSGPGIKMVETKRFKGNTPPRRPDRPDRADWPAPRDANHSPARRRRR